MWLLPIFELRNFFPLLITSKSFPLLIPLLNTIKKQACTLNWAYTASLYYTAIKNRIEMQAFLKILHLISCIEHRYFLSGTNFL